MMAGDPAGVTQRIGATHAAATQLGEICGPPDPKACVAMDSLFNLFAARAYGPVRALCLHVDGRAAAGKQRSLG
jgi:hypothetical protein